MYKLIVSDIDGTLIHDDMTIGEKTKEAIRKAHGMGIRFAISSGRFLSGITFLGKELGIPTLYSCVNGAVIADEDRIISARSLSDDAYRKVMELTRGRTESMMVFGTSRYAFEGNDYWFGFQTKLYNGNAGLRIDIGDPEDVRNTMGEPILKILMKDRDPQKLLDLMAELKEKLPGVADFTLSGQHAFEATSCGVTKGSAIDSLCSYLGIDSSEVIAFGDYDNDIPMFEKAGLAVVMANGTEKAKTKADYMTLSNEEDGIAAALEKFVF